MIGEALSRPRERIRWQRWGYANYPQEFEGAKNQQRRLEGTEREAQYHGKKIQAR